MCTKVPHLSRHAAARAALQISRRSGFTGQLWIYPCRDCRCWHLTSHRVGKKWQNLQLNVR